MPAVLLVGACHTHALHTCGLPATRATRGQCEKELSVEDGGSPLPWSRTAHGHLWLEATSQESRLRRDPRAGPWPTPGVAGVGRL